MIAWGDSGRLAMKMGYQPVLWTGQAFDWKPTATAAQIEDDIEAATKPGAVILLHDGGGDRNGTVEAVARLLRFWSRNGYALKTIPVCEGLTTAPASPPNWGQG